MGQLDQVTQTCKPRRTPRQAESGRARHLPRGSNTGSPPPRPAPWRCRAGCTVMKEPWTWHGETHAGRQAQPFKRAAGRSQSAASPSRTCFRKAGRARGARGSAVLSALAPSRAPGLRARPLWPPSLSPAVPFCLLLFCFFSPAPTGKPRASDPDACLGRRPTEPGDAPLETKATPPRTLAAAPHLSQ